MRWTRTASSSEREAHVKSMLIGMTVLGLALAGCGDDDPGPSITCSGEGCSCTGAACECVAGQDCSANCRNADCSLACTMDAKCNLEGEASVVLVCSDTSQCKGNGGDASMITCEDSS